MSMLAERKTKQKWSLNPRGKQWSEDQNKFGQKLLEKMGWSKGKGLGAKENGLTEHIKIPYKNDSKGMGYKETNEQWTEHDSNFNALLEALRESNKVKTIEKVETSNGFVSLEEKSQSSKVRVHYKKFTRGKDLSRCSEKDLAQIFGRRTNKTLSEESNNEQPNKNGETDNENINFTYNTLSIKDYFKKKVPNFGKFNGYEIGSNGVLRTSDKVESEDEGNERCGFGFKSSPAKDINPSSDLETKDVEKKKRKKSKHKETEFEESSKKLKLENGISNPAFEPLFNKIEVKKHVLETIEENEGESQEIIYSPSLNNTVNSDSLTKEPKNKKKKRKNGEISALDNPVFSEYQSENQEESINNSQFEIKRKTKKKRIVKSENGELNEENKTNILEKNLALDNPSFNASSLNESNDETRKAKKRKSSGNEESIQNDELSFEVKRKKKNKRNGEFALENPGFNGLETAEILTPNTSFEVKRKNKIKIIENLIISNSVFNSSTEESSSKIDDPNVNLEIKRQKKSKKVKAFAIDNVAFNDTSGDNLEETPNQTELNFEVKRKKKKSKKDDEQTPSHKKDKIEESIAIDNPSFKDSPKNEEIKLSEPIFEDNLILNVTATPILKPTPSKTSEKKNLKRRKSVRFSDVNEERIIPSKEEIQGNEDLQSRQELFDINAKVIENGVNENEFSRKIDQIEAEIENDLNEAKDRVVGQKDMELNTTLLKFKDVHFEYPKMRIRGSPSFAKKSYRHLIKGDVVLAFKNTNLHEIEGYANNKRKK